MKHETEITQKFQAGDRVKVKHGHLIWENTASGDPPFKESDQMEFVLQEGPIKWWDMRPELKADTATVVGSYGDLYGKAYGGWARTSRYCLNFDKHGQISWFAERDIILIEKVNNGSDL